MAKVFRTPIQGDVQNFGSASSYAGFSSASTASYSFYAGAQNTSGSTAQFSVTPAGTLVSNSASIAGVVTFTSGTLGPFTVSSSALSSSSGTFSASTGSFSSNLTASVGTTTLGTTNVGAFTATSASIGANAIATQSYVTGLGYLTSSGSIASASNSASLGERPASYYAPIASPNFTTGASVGGAALATQSFVTTSYAPIASPSFTGTVNLGSNTATGSVSYATNAGNATTTSQTSFTNLSANSASIISTSSAVVPMTIFTASGQTTGNVQEWKNSSGTILSYIRYDGLMSIGGSGLVTGTIRASSGTGGRINLSSNNPITIDTTSSVVIPLIVKSTASQTVDIQQWQNNSSSVIMSVSASTTPLVVRNVQGSTYTQIWQQQNGNTAAVLTNAGGFLAYNSLQILTTGNICNNNGTAAGFLQFSASGPKIGTTTASNVTLTVTAASAQSANIQEWQNSSGSVLANITASGGANFASASVNGQTVYTQATAPYQTIPFGVTGTPTAQLYTQRLYNDTGSTRYVVGVRASLGASATASTSIDVLKSGTSIFSSSAARPVIAASGYTSGLVSASISGSAVTTTDYLQVQVISVGTGASDLTVQVTWS